MSRNAVGHYDPEIEFGRTHPEIEFGHYDPDFFHGFRQQTNVTKLWSSGKQGLQATRTNKSGSK